MMKSTYLYLLIFTSILFAVDPSIKNIDSNVPDRYRKTNTAKIGDYPFPTNPMSDRAKGFIDQGRVKTAIANYGSFINWDFHPSGIWGDYSYLPAVSFIAGVPGNKNTNNFNWTQLETVIDDDGAPLYSTWSSTAAYDDWYPASGDTVYKGIIFELDADDGLYQPENEKFSLDGFDNDKQFFFDHENRKIILSTLGESDPAKSSTRVGFIYPWALRPALISREDQFDYYDYGEDDEEWTDDDNYTYYGANSAESHFISPEQKTDWHAGTMSRINTHQTENNASDIFSETPWVSGEDTYPVLAHSGYSQTWPTRLNNATGEMDSYWPGWWAEDYNINLPGCSKSRKDPDCWESVPGRFISDMDVYMEFDDRWAHRANNVNTNDEYEQTGYPMGLRVMAEAHSYGVSYAEDIMFVTVKVRNESGDWCAEDEDGNPVYDSDGTRLCGEGMIMPDGTKLNGGKGFDYSGMALGFYMDADVLMGDWDGYNSGLHTNDDDFMKYYWELFEVNNDRMLISMAMIGDHDGGSGVPGYILDEPSATAHPGNEFGIVATQLLDSPKATDPIDLDQDGTIDIFPGEPLKMTDWHWVDWYQRPGIVSPESNSPSCYAGSDGCPVARNKEEILYKLMVGDTSNLSVGEKNWHFHTPNPGTDLGSELNPHFDSVVGLKEEPVYLREPLGLDCVLIMSCAPFDLPVGREVPFSFCIIFGQTEDDLVNNARFAQVMYNSRYQGFTPPTKPTVHAETDQGEVRIYWNNHAENSRDVVTGYADFEGYKLYKSNDGGGSWGSADDMIYDTDGIFAGWRPYKQYDLTALEDSLHCIYSGDVDCSGSESRNHAINGEDPYFPWFTLGNDNGFDAIRLDEPKVIDGDTMIYVYIDRNVVDGLEYTYSIVAYDMGVEPPFNTSYKDIGNGQFETVIDTNYSNPDQWADPSGYASIENSKGTTVLDRNFVQVYPGVMPAANVSNIGVVPNPYIVQSGYKESEHLRQIRFTNLPSHCRIRIFTISGECVAGCNDNNPFEHQSEFTGNAWWDMRSENNQEIAPGLYLFHVEQLSSDGKKVLGEHIGKFAVIR
jgi:hypothetical protein